MNQYEFDKAFERPGVEYLSDCERIQLVGASIGISMSLKQAEIVWRAESETMAAGWLFIEDGEEGDAAIRSAIECYSSRRYL